ncbi:unnamed protein product, partial [Enterobius vermicularis]|uniref:XkdX family protein n=1 Tax=Enterobius vermicularis TaxID=51028 RepID=A0A0N4UUC8_ENTVE
MDIYGRFYTRIQDTTAKFGYQAAPVNMLGLTKADFVKLMSDPSKKERKNRKFWCTLFSLYI